MVLIRFELDVDQMLYTWVGLITVGLIMILSQS